MTFGQLPRRRIDVDNFRFPMPRWNFDNAVLALTVATFNHIANQAMVVSSRVRARSILFIELK
jgi:hypothetical protein